jgi:HEAT repeat protein
MLDQAFETLKTFDFGTPLSDVQAIEDAVVTANSDAAVRENLEQRLINALSTNISRDAKDYVCRKLAMIGTAASVPTLASLLSHQGNAHLARHALERIPGREASDALVSAAKTLAGNLQLGAIASLGARGDSGAVETLSGSLTASDAGVVRAAALALGAIGGAESAQALQAALQAGSANDGAVIDGLLSCAESLLKQNNSRAANAIYQTLAGDDQPRLVRLAATRGLLASST